MGEVCCKQKCALESRAVTTRLNDWEAKNPRPVEVDLPNAPRNFSSSNFQCCVNLVSNVTVENSAQILQECSQQIVNHLSPEEKAEEEKHHQELRDKLISTQEAAEMKKRTLSVGIIIIVIALIVLLIIGGVIIIKQGR